MSLKLTAFLFQTGRGPHPSREEADHKGEILHRLRKVPDIFPEREAGRRKNKGCATEANPNEGPGHCKGHQQGYGSSSEWGNDFLLLHYNISNASIEKDHRLSHLSLLLICFQGQGKQGEEPHPSRGPGRLQGEEQGDDPENSR